MIRSMTGFGRVDHGNSGWAVRIEVKSVNHRYLDIALRLPKSYSVLEEPIRRFIKGNFDRGRVEIYLALEDLREKERMVKVDRPLLTGYIKTLKSLAGELDSRANLTIEHILQLPDVLQVTEPEIDWDELTKVVLEGLSQANQGIQEMRLQEGHKLATDILHKLDKVEHLIQRIQERAPEIVSAYRHRLQERLSELLEGTSLSQERFDMEVALFADRCSIDEEIVRLGSHTQQFRQSLQQGGPIGRKLDFLLQEMNREMNTIGSKANDVEIARLVVDGKSELEKIREQVQNIE